MKIILDENWSIEGIPMNYVLREQYISYGTGRNQGTPRMVVADRGYYTKVEHAIASYANKALKDRTEDFEGTLDEYIARMQNVMNSAVDRMIKEVSRWEKG